MDSSHTTFHRQVPGLSVVRAIGWVAAGLFIPMAAQVGATWWFLSSRNDDEKWSDPGLYLVGGAAYVVAVIVLVLVAAWRGGAARVAFVLAAPFAVVVTAVGYSVLEGAGVID